MKNTIKVTFTPVAKGWDIAIAHGVDSALLRGAADALRQEADALDAAAAGKRALQNVRAGLRWAARRRRP